MSEECPKCFISCATCEITAMECLTCQGNRFQQGTNCLCPDGTFEDFSSLVCPPCGHKCLTCNRAELDCVLCRGDREQSTCICREGYFDDLLSELCQKCDLSCVTCDVRGCLSCSDNRMGPNLLYECPCPEQSFDLRSLGLSFCQSNFEFPSPDFSKLATLGCPTRRSETTWSH